MTAPKHIADELHRAGIRDYDVRPGGKHPRVLFEHMGRLRMFVFAATPSDRRASRNERAGIRRLMRQPA